MATETKKKVIKVAISGMEDLTNKINSLMKETKTKETKLRIFRKGPVTMGVGLALRYLDKKQYNKAAEVLKIVPRYGPSFGVDEREYNTFKEMAQKLENFSETPNQVELKNIKKRLKVYKKGLDIDIL
jgi:hypothetical protein